MRGSSGKSNNKGKNDIKTIGITIMIITNVSENTCTYQ